MVEVRVSSVVNCSIITNIQLLCVKWSPVPLLMPYLGTLTTTEATQAMQATEATSNSLLPYLPYLVNEVGLG